MRDTVPFAIDNVSALWASRQRLLTEIEERNLAIKQIDDLLKEQLPEEDHVTALIDGRPAFTYGYTQRWTEAKFREDYPQLFDQYKRPVLKDVMDWDTFAKEHPALAKQYQVRALTPHRPRKAH